MIDEVRADPMMSSLLDRLGRGEDIGHYGRLVFAMVARHFADDDAVVGALRQDKDFSDEQARELLVQVEDADYSPPKREKILEFQSRQTQPIITDPDDPDAGNVYKHLQFPDHVYDHIAQYRDAKAHAHS